SHRRRPPRLRYRPTHLCLLRFLPCHPSRPCLLRFLPCHPSRPCLLRFLPFHPSRRPCLLLLRPYLRSRRRALRHAHRPSQPPNRRRHRAFAHQKDSKLNNLPPATAAGPRENGQATTSPSDSCRSGRDSVWCLARPSDFPSSIHARRACRQPHLPCCKRRLSRSVPKCARCPAEILRKTGSASSVQAPHAGFSPDCAPTGALFERRSPLLRC